MPTIRAPRKRRAGLDRRRVGAPCRRGRPASPSWRRDRRWTPWRLAPGRPALRLLGLQPWAPLSRPPFL